MIKVVIDTNVFVSGAIWFPSKPGMVLNLFRNKQFKLICSEILFNEIISTLNKISQKESMSKKFIGLWFEILQTHAQWIRNLPSTNICRDPKDNLVLATAVTGKADYLITGDQDLLSLKKYQHIKILTPAKFLTLINS